MSQANWLRFGQLKASVGIGLKLAELKKFSVTLGLESTVLCSELGSIFFISLFFLG